MAAEVDVFIGTKGTGHTFPGAVRPFGKVQLSPDVGQNGWQFCSGYQKDQPITRVSHIHLSGTGAGDGYDIGWKFEAFKPTHEEGFPGYYKATGPNGQSLELTVSDSCGLIRYENMVMKLDLQSSINWDKTLATKHVEQENSGHGYRESKGWTTNKVYFNYSHEPGLIMTCIDHKAIPNREEIDFEDALDESWKLWKQHLSPIETSKTVLSTALYHAIIHPSKYDEDTYTVFSTWDTYRAWNSLMTWIYPEYIEAWTRSLLRSEYLPIWELWGRDTQMMSGTHSVSMVGEYVLKGLIPVEMVWDKIDKTLFRKDRHYDDYYSIGYVPKESCNVATSVTLEHAYTDYVLEQIMAKYNVTLRRKLNSKSYANVFSDEMFYSRRRSGHFDKAFHNRINHGFEEGSALTYQWSVVHDFKGLIGLHDHDKDLSSCSETLPCTEQIDGKMLERLNSWFSTPGICGQYQDMSDCIGQYVHSNEPNHHVIYLYTVLGHPELTCQYVKQAANFYSEKPGGIPGNSDCGATDAWLIYAALGFYPVNPASGVYILGCPVYKEPLKLKNLLVTNEGEGYNPEYYWNDVQYNKLYITHEMLLEGGHFHVKLT